MQTSLLYLFCLIAVTTIFANENDYKKFSIDLRGWSANRTLTDWQALNSLLNTSPGQYSHLRGGKIEDEKVGPELCVTASYFLHKNLAINMGVGYLPGNTTAQFVEEGTPHSMFWKSHYFFVPINLEYKIPFISAERLWIKVFGGGSFHSLSSEIKSDSYQEYILNTEASGRAFGYQYGILFEYALTENLSVFFHSTEWHGDLDSIEKDGQPIKLSDFRLDSEENLRIDLNGRTQLVGVRFYF